MQNATWLYWKLDDDRHVLELNERLTPPGCALEFEILTADGYAKTFAVWRVSNTGAVIAIVEAESA